MPHSVGGLRSDIRRRIVEQPDNARSHGWGAETTKSPDGQSAKFRIGRSRRLIEQREVTHFEVRRTMVTGATRAEQTTVGGEDDGFARQRFSGGARLVNTTRLDRRRRSGRLRDNEREEGQRRAYFKDGHMRGSLSRPATVHRSGHAAID